MWVYVVNSHKESSLLGEADAVRLGIVTINLKGARAPVAIKNVEYIPKKLMTINQAVSGWQTQQEIDRDMDIFKKQFSSTFTHSTGKFHGAPIKIQIDKNATAVIQPRRRIPLHYIDRLETELKKMMKKILLKGH